MKTLALSAVLALLTCLPAAAQVPDLIESESGGFPDWLSINEIEAWVAEEPEVLEHPDLSEIKKLRLLAQESREADTNIQPGECRTVTIAGCSGFPPVRVPMSLQEFHEDPIETLLGRVIGLQTGVFRGEVGTLYRVDVETVFKGPARRSPPQSYLFFLRSARITFDGVTHCERDVRGIDRPALGSRILLTLLWTTTDAQRVLTPSDFELFFTLPEGRTSYPESLGDEKPTFDRILQILGKFPGS